MRLVDISSTTNMNTAPTDVPGSKVEHVAYILYWNLKLNQVET